MKNKTQHRRRRMGFILTKANISVSLMSLVWCLNGASIVAFHSQHKKTKQQKPKNNHNKTLYDSTEKEARSNQSWRGSRWRSRVDYLFGCLFLFHTIPNYNIYYFPAKPLHYALKATLFSCKNTNKQGEEGGSHGQRGQSSGALCLPGWLHALHPSHRQSQHM